ncbi:malto-oligosyltrehalose trehalohydrolase [Rhizobium sp. 16-449-1b]|uniref:malto-oligosyltrehalose trehalohydrolase n=1 Tax=Rhizobium sp. 16-449-1b TaxID=2819989 RepID=UPI001ADCDB8D|nr:malto-oligosyltrehalose trehalohydrolase [Rhizobium sp. 16-449-1b]
MTDLQFGPVISDRGVTFRLWAPLLDNIRLKLQDHEPQPMRQLADGWHELEVAGIGAGALYRFVLPDGLQVPDPASRFQPHDVHGFSEVEDLKTYDWKEEAWRGRPWEETVLYELHIGTFTEEGTFLAAIGRLDHLARLGVTAMQLMPLADFPGRYGWGYDGVLPYAPDSSYGRPEHLMALVDAAHERGISVFLDVVYNHFGPDGNYLRLYAPVFTDRHETPWGKGIDYDGAMARPMREFVIQNAIYWITVFRLDGLRLDAVHAISDGSEEHLLLELARRVRVAAGDRHIHLIVENEENDSDLLKRASNGETGLFTAQWNDDIHHTLHVAATGERFGYYADYAEDSEALARSLAEGFVFQGQHMPYRGESRGKSTRDLPPTAFVSFIQNHDQIGNRAMGDRIIAAQPVPVIKAMAAIYLLAPQIPMLFMGEEWGARDAFPYFCDLNEELNEMVRNGRREELSRLPGFDTDDLLDPTAPSTFEMAKLDWSNLTEPDCAEMHDFYTSLLAIRHQKIVPLLAGMQRGEIVAGSGFTAVAVDWPLASGGRLCLRTNLGNETIALEPAADEAETIFGSGASSAKNLTPWSVYWSVSRE